MGRACRQFFRRLFLLGVGFAQLPAVLWQTVDHPALAAVACLGMTIWIRCLGFGARESCFRLSPTEVLRGV